MSEHGVFNNNNEGLLHFFIPLKIQLSYFKVSGLRLSSKVCVVDHLVIPQEENVNVFFS